MSGVLLGAVAVALAATGSIPAAADAIPGKPETERLPFDREELVFGSPSDLAVLLG